MQLLSGVHTQDWVDGLYWVLPHLSPPRARDVYSLTYILQGHQ